MTRDRAGAAPTTLWVAFGLTVVSLGLRWTSSSRGYQLNVRVLLAGAAAALVFAGLEWADRPGRARTLLNVATALLVVALALRLRGISLTALFTVLGAVGATVASRRRLPVRPVLAGGGGGSAHG